MAEEDSYTDFPFLKHNGTIDYIKKSRVLFLMRGLPGSGKSTLVRLLQETYPENTVCSADNYFLQEDGSYRWSKEKLPVAHDICHDNTKKACEAKIPTVIVDNTNIRRWEMKFYVGLASQHCYTVVVVSPKTPWCFDVLELSKRNKHNVPIDALEEKKKAFENEFVCPLYWGWFVNVKTTDGILEMADKYFQLVVKNCEEFADFMINDSKEPLIFSARYNREGSSTYTLHCTSFFGGHSRNDKSIAYSDHPDVKKAMGKATALTIVGIVITPRTVGARVKLTEKQLRLWGKDDEDGEELKITTKMADLSVREDGESSNSEKISRFQPTHGNGSRAHLTLGCSRGFTAVQTGNDQIGVIKQEAQNVWDESFIQIEGGAVRYYGQGRAVVYFDEPMNVHALFSGKYV